MDNNNRDGIMGGNDNTGGISVNAASKSVNAAGKSVNAADKSVNAAVCPDKCKILVAEDDGDINLLLCKILNKAGYETSQAYSGTEAKLLIGISAPDMLILDLMLPGLTGEELIDLIRGQMGLDMPILVISAKAGLESRVAALKSGADDYLVKPFEPEEVVARVYAALRRYRGQPSKVVVPKGSGAGNGNLEKLSYKKLCLYPDARRAVIEEEELTLTAHEFDILQLLISRPDKVFSREYLYEQVWRGGYYGEDNTVNVHVSNLRKKLAAADPGQEYIKTVWGIGFKMA